MTIKRTVKHTANWRPGVIAPSGAMYMAVCAVRLSFASLLGGRLGHEAASDRRPNKY